MKKKLQLLLKFLRRLTVFDWLVILVVLSGLIFLTMFIFKQEKWVEVEVKLSRADWWWPEMNQPPYWLVDRIWEGDKQYDSLGRKIAEVLEIRSYEQQDGMKMAYLKLNMNAEVDRRRGTLRFNHQPLEIGQPIDLELGNVGTQGLVTYIEGVADTRAWEEKIVEAQVTNWSSVFPETLGLLPWRAEAIKKGDQMKDTRGRAIAEVIDKKVKAADKVVVSSDGRVFVRSDPLKKDVILTLKLQTVKHEGVNYFLDDIKIKVGHFIYLALPEIDIWPEITRIIE